MLDLSFFLYCLCVYFGTGWLIHRALRVHTGLFLFIVPCTGAAFVLSFSNICYFLGVGSGTIFLLETALAAAGIAFFIRFGTVSAGFRAQVRRNRWLLLIFACVCLLVLGPKWAGGNHFALFQGNVIDTLGYILSASGYSRYPFSFIEHAAEPERLMDPLLISAKGNLFSRPAVHLLYGVLAHFSSVDLWQMHYAFLSVFLSISVLSITFLLCSLLRATALRALLIGSAFAMGFWGQYIFDINSWSQLASTSLLIAMVALLVVIYMHDEPVPAGLYALLIVYVSGCLYTYPESFFLTAFCIGFALTLVHLRMRRTDRFLRITGASAAGIATGLFCYRAVIGFALDQLRVVSANNVDWWVYFQAYLAGRDGLAQASPGLPSFENLIRDVPVRLAFFNISDFVSGLAGLYFVTPTEHAVRNWKMGGRILLMLFTGALIVSSLLRSRTEWKAARKPELIALWLFALCTVLCVVALALKGNYWAAGKAISYFSPYYTALTVLPFARALPLRDRYAFASLAFLLLSFSFGLSRVQAARRADGLPYAYPYPLALREMKAKYNFALDRFDADLERCRTVRIDVQERYYEYFAMLYLTSHRKQFYTDRPVNGYYGLAPENIGSMPRVSDPDCVLTETYLGRPKPQ